jgi:gluconolactonase
LKSTIVVLGLSFLLSACTQAPAPQTVKSEAAPAIPEIRAELIASDPSWGNTEGPALDSKNNLYFCSRGTWKGIVRWNKNGGAERYAEVASKAGPGGLWVDDADNIFLTATDEREVWRLSPSKKVSVIAKAGFEADPKLAKGPNDVVTAKNGTVYFTDPNGYYGDAPNGTVYRIDKGGQTEVFSAGITGPNGIVLSLDEKTLYVSHNIAKATSRITSWKLNENGSAGAMQEFATVPDCVADGMAIDTEGAVWLTCYSFGAAYRVVQGGKMTHKITTEQKALTNIRFGRGSDNRALYLTSSDMERVTGYVYRAAAPVAGSR